MFEVPVQGAGPVEDATTPVLEGRGLSRSFGRLQAVRDVSVHVSPGEILALVGANGAGKTTLLNLLSGAIRVSAGTVHIDGKDVTRRDLSTRARMGVIRTFQLPRVVPRLTVLENVMVGVRRGGRLSALDARTERQMVERAADALSRINIPRERWMRRASEVPPAERRWLEFARVIAGSPRIALLDEPSSGMSRGETERLGELIHMMAGASGAGVLLVTHDVSLATSVGTRMLVMHQGGQLAAGDVQQVLASEEVMAAYLGVRTAAALQTTRSGGGH